MARCRPRHKVCAVGAAIASSDTIRGYRTQVTEWVSWCKSQQIDPAFATTEDVKRYREDLVSGKYKPASIAHRLVVLRRLYQAAINAGMRADNPAAGVRARGASARWKTSVT